MDTISVVVDLPRLEPSDWGKWWAHWDKNSKMLTKENTNHNTYKAGGWCGFDCYRKPYYNPKATAYMSSLVDCSAVFPELYTFIDCIPMEVYLVRILESMSAFVPHNDFTKPHYAWRTLLFDNNPSSTFYYMNGEEKIYQRLPDKESNTWVFKDHITKHGTDYDPRYKKLLITYYGENRNDPYMDTIFNDQKYSTYSVKLCK